MTLPVTGSGRHLLVELETSTPGTYAVICGFNERSLKASRPAVDQSVQDCEDPDVVVVERDVGPMSWEVSGSGVATKAGTISLNDWWVSGEAKNIRVKQDSGTGWSQWTGAALLTDFEISGNIDGGKQAITATIVSSGLWTRSTIS